MIDKGYAAMRMSWTGAHSGRVPLRHFRQRLQAILAFLAVPVFRIAGIAKSP